MQVGYFLKAKRYFISNIVAAMWLCCFISGCKGHQQTQSNIHPTPSPVVTSTADEQAATLNELREIGKKVMSSVLAKDGAALLPYDRADLRSEDETAIKNKNSNLYCYLFETSCISGQKAPSVYEKLSMARQSEIDASVTKSPDGKLYGLLIFYDKSKISEKQLNADFICTDTVFNTISSWHFVFADGKWNSATPLFDKDTDALCSN